MVGISESLILKSKLLIMETLIKINPQKVHFLTSKFVTLVAPCRTLRHYDTTTLRHYDTTTLQTFRRFSLLNPGIFLLVFLFFSYPISAQSQQGANCSNPLSFGIMNGNFIQQQNKEFWASFNHSMDSLIIGLNITGANRPDSIRLFSGQCGNLSLQTTMVIPVQGNNDTVFAFNLPSGSYFLSIYKDTLCPTCNDTLRYELYIKSMGGGGTTSPCPPNTCPFTNLSCEEVCNPGFEYFFSAPNQAGQINLACPWVNTGTETTPDFFHSSFTNPATGTYAILDVPQNSFGSMNSLNQGGMFSTTPGSGYSGIIAAGTTAGGGFGYYEYLSNTLNNPLIIGETYQVRFNISLACVSEVMLDKISLLFFTQTPGNTVSIQNGIGFSTMAPTLTFNGLPTTPGSWVQLSANFVATSAWNSLAIGLFEEADYNINATSISNAGCNAIQYQGQYISDINASDWAYYFIDEVHLKKSAPDLHLVPYVYCSEICEETTSLCNSPNNAQWSFTATSNTPQSFPSGTIFNWLVSPNALINPASTSAIGEPVSTTFQSNNVGGTVYVQAVIPPNNCSYEYSLVVEPCCLAEAPVGMNAVYEINAGNPAGSTDASLIFTGTAPISPANPASQCLIINGELIIDQNLTLSNWDHIILGEDAKIFVEAGRTLIISNSHLYSGCNKMWHKIEVEAGGVLYLTDNIIEDAKLAVFLPGCPAPQTAYIYGAFNNNLFKNNFRNIYAKGCDDAGLAGLIIRGNTFTCTTGSLKGPYDGPQSRSQSGVDFLNMGPLALVPNQALNAAYTIGKTLASNQGNTFNNLFYGIRTNNSRVNIWGNTFTNIYAPPTTLSPAGFNPYPNIVCQAIQPLPFPTAFQGYAIYSGNPTSSPVLFPNQIELFVGGPSPFQANTISNCANGIYQYGSAGIQIEGNNIQVSNTTNAGNGSAIVIKSAQDILHPLNHHNIKIHNNNLNRFRNGITINSSGKAFTSITANLIQPTGAMASSGINIQDPVSPVATGGKTEIFDNNQINNCQTGININNVLNVLIKENTIYVPNLNAFSPLTPAASGIKLSNISGTISWGYSNTGQGYQIYSGPRVYSNLIEKTGANPLPNQTNKVFGIYIDKITGFDILDNTINKVGTSVYTRNNCIKGYYRCNHLSNGYKGFDFYNATIISQYGQRPTGNEWLTAFTFNLAGNFLPAASTKWFYRLTPSIENANPHNTFGLWGNAPQISNLGINCTGFTNSGFTSGGPSAYSTSSITSTEREELFGLVVRSADTYPAYQEMNQLQARWDLFELLHNEPTVKIMNVPEDSLYLQFYDSAKVASAGDAGEMLDYLVYGDTAQARLALEEIIVNNGFDESLKEVYGIYLEQIITRNQEIGEDNLLLLYDIFREDPGARGEAVHIARALLDSIVYDEEVQLAERIGINEDWIQLDENPQENKLDLLPNPTKDQLQLKYQISSPFAQIKISNALGQIQESYSIENQKGSLNVNTQNLKPGVYFVSIWFGKEMLCNEKLFIQ